MNPMTNVKNVLKLSERELKNESKSSWHDQYRNSAWIFIGGLPYDLTEGDILGRTVRVDHCEQYRAPNADMTKLDDLTVQIRTEGCAPAPIKETKQEEQTVTKAELKRKKKTKDKKKKSKKKKKKKSRCSDSESSSSDS
ncbi:RNA-binding motif protein, X-linked 2 [Eumeta japonica]|uniref:RNA-binding motif protein, X-linked 2 n=1 Tax=Eumeta variegata TaxID=151549 RepID=A0A4C1WAZ4_EUMVA|nr:RNA-binding motif protein, X-linked 2 [Eumeta japonica]